MKNWVILFVKTGAEEQVLHTLKHKLGPSEYLPFIPLKEAPRISRGIVTKVRKRLFPGYVFIQSPINADLIAGKLQQIITDVVQHKDIYSLLHYGANKKDVVLREKERRYWERLFDDDFCITGSVGFFEGDKIVITSGALMGKEGSIKKINLHKRQALVELELMGAAREIRLMLEIIKKNVTVGAAPRGRPSFSAQSINKLPHPPQHIVY
jgi:transcriptional antiterminator NusG